MLNVKSVKIVYFRHENVASELLLIEFSFRIFLFNNNNNNNNRI